jgi:hypothetical protein
MRKKPNIFERAWGNLQSALKMQPNHDGPDPLPGSNILERLRRDGLLPKQAPKDTLG